VLTTPAIAILKRFRPDFEIGVVVENRFRAVYEGNPDIAEILPPELGAVRNWDAKLCVNLHGGGRSGWMTALSGASLRAGFQHFRNQAIYNVRIPRAQQILRVERKVHTAEHIASAMFYLGVPECEIPRARLFPDGGTRSAVAVIHPFASAPDKTWAAAGFVEVAEKLRGSGLEPVFIGSSADDFAPFARFRTLAGVSLEEVKRLLAGASLFVGNDSGPAHMAAAYGLPVVVLFGASDSVIWAPWRTASEIVRIDAPAAQVWDAIVRLQVPA
jgi:ADP-heptose:LPS heptosyltransferase